MLEACSLASVEAAEPLVGTASVGHRHVLISWPKGQWEEAALRAPALAPVATWGARYDERRHQGKTVLRLFAGPADPAGVEVRMFPGGWRLAAVPLAELPTELDRAFEAIEAGRTPEGADRCSRTLAVCTHGKHDRCCAKHGQALFQALSDGAGPLGFDVLESTHLGGHRFAATLLDLDRTEPGRMYGRLRASDAPTLLERLAAGEVWLDRYRGRTDLGAEEQIAEAEALSAGATDGVTIERVEPGHLVARWTGGQVAVRIETARFSSPRSCGEDPKPWSRPIRSSAGI